MIFLPDRTFVIVHTQHTHGTTFVKHLLDLAASGEGFNVLPCRSTIWRRGTYDVRPSVSNLFNRPNDSGAWLIGQCAVDWPGHDRGTSSTIYLQLCIMEHTHTHTRTHTHTVTHTEYSFSSQYFVRDNVLQFYNFLLLQFVIIYAVTQTGGPNTRITNPEWRTAAILEKSNNRHISQTLWPIVTKFGTVT